MLQKDYSGTYCKGPSYSDSSLKSKNSKKAYIDSFGLIGFLKNKKWLTNFKNDYGQFINEKIKKIKELSLVIDAYANTIFAYVLALEGSTENVAASKIILQQLKDSNSMKNGDKTFYFYTADNVASDLKFQMSAYIALTYMTLAEHDSRLISEVEPIINWLAGIKAYGEPYNSAMVTEALTEAAKLMSKTEANYELTLTASDNQVIFDVNKDNWRNYQFKEVSTKSHEIKMNATGEGYLSVDVVCEQYNQRAEISDFINLKVSTSGISRKSDKIGYLNMCVSCKQGKCSDMVLLEVQLQSGFIYDASLNDLTKQKIIKVSELINIL